MKTSLILFIILLSAFFQGCKKEPIAPAQNISVRLYEGGVYAWKGIKIDPNLPSLCTDKTGTQNKLLILSKAFPDYFEQSNYTAVDYPDVWVRTSTQIAIPLPAYTEKRIIEGTCSDFNITVRERLFDANTGKFVDGEIIGNVGADCTLTLTVNHRPRAIMIEVSTRFTAADLYPEISGAKVRNTSAGLFIDCGPL